MLAHASLRRIRYPPKKTRFEPISGRRHLRPRRRLSNTCRIWCADGPDSRAECVSRIMCNGRMGIATQPAVNSSKLVLFGWVTLCKCGYFTGCFKSTPSFEFGVPPPPPEFVLHMTSSWEFWPIRCGSSFSGIHYSTISTIRSVASLGTCCASCKSLKTMW